MQRTIRRNCGIGIVLLAQLLIVPTIARASASMDELAIELWQVIGQGIAERGSWKSYEILNFDTAAAIIDAARDELHMRRFPGVYGLGLIDSMDARDELSRARSDRLEGIRSLARFSTIISECRHLDPLSRRAYLLMALEIETDNLVALLLSNWLCSEFGDDVSIDLFDSYYGAVSPSVDLELLYHLARSSNDKARERLVVAASESAFVSYGDPPQDWQIILPFLRPGVWPEMGNSRFNILSAVRSPEFGRTVRPPGTYPRTDRPMVYPTRDGR